MTVRGKVKNGVVVLERPELLPDGANVEVRALEDTANSNSPELAGPTWGEVLKEVIGTAEGLPSDLADNHDHYVHGKAKQ